MRSKSAIEKKRHPAAKQGTAPAPHLQPFTPGSQPAPRPAPNPRIRVLLVDDHPIVRWGIRSCLARYDHIEVVAEGCDGVEGLRLAREHQPDVILTDIDMPHMNGLALTDALRREVPKSRVLILSMYTNSGYVLRIIRSGAKGYVLKEADSSELIQAIETVFRGDAFFSPDAARVALNQFVRGSGDDSSGTELSAREREVLVGIAEGLSNKEIASKLGVGVRTIETHRENIMTKLDIHSVAGLTKYAVSKGMVGLTAGQ
jgi:two-component system nitrate/nitrite response regulator NarL